MSDRPGPPPVVLLVDDDERIRKAVGTGLTLEVVGMVRDIKEGPLDDATRPAFYIPFAEDPGPSFSVVLRSSRDDASLLPIARYFKAL